jgi:hypothetical protein
MLLIVIAALCVAMVVQNRQAAFRERELQLRMESLAQELVASRDLQVANAARVQARELQKMEVKNDERK